MSVSNPKARKPSTPAPTSAESVAATATDPAKPTLKRNPEIDARLDRFIELNPKLATYFRELSKEDLVRKLMVQKMFSQDRAADQFQSLVRWAEQDPALAARVKATLQDATRKPEVNQRIAANIIQKAQSATLAKEAPRQRMGM